VDKPERVIYWFYFERSGPRALNRWKSAFKGFDSGEPWAGPGAWTTPIDHGDRQANICVGLELGPDDDRDDELDGAWETAIAKLRDLYPGATCAE
jgi:hypothetical protein